ncbi:MAG: gluconeogenesis factor YvcK family protein [Candidatus Berkelbacteria bacterium]
MKKFFKKWFNSLKYEPTDPRHRAGGVIRIVALGGGTGLSTLLKGLKLYSNEITAVVSVADNGSSSGKLRKEFDVLPPGDIRKCLSALAEDEKMMTDILEYRFRNAGSGLDNHTLGNIWLTGLSQRYGSFAKAIEITSELFATHGEVLPASLEKLDLCTLYDDGKQVKGEDNLDKIVGKKIQKIFYQQEKVKANPRVIKAIAAADLILIGPGSLYGSVIPNLLIPGIRRAIVHNSRAVKIYISNCSTERTQTAGYTVENHIEEIFAHSQKGLFGHCLVNSKLMKKSAKETVLGEINNITTTDKVIAGVSIFRKDVVDRQNPLFHNPNLLAKTLIEMYNGIKAGNNV